MEIKCNYCGEEFEEGEAELTKVIEMYGANLVEEEVCTYCLKKHYVRCSECGGYYNPDVCTPAYPGGGAYDDVEQKYICPDCYEKYGYAECECCHEHDRAIGIKIVFGVTGETKFFCDNCAEIVLSELKCLVDDWGEVWKDEMLTFDRKEEECTKVYRFNIDSGEILKEAIELHK